MERRLEVKEERKRSTMKYNEWIRKKKENRKRKKNKKRKMKKKNENNEKQKSMEEKEMKYTDMF